MYLTLDQSLFRQQFENYNRVDNFGYDGLEVLFDYLEEIDNNMELDVIALCCEFSANYPCDIARYYSIELDDDLSAEDVAEVVLDWLYDNTAVCGVCFDGKIVYCSAF